MDIFFHIVLFTLRLSQSCTFQSSRMYLGTWVHWCGCFVSETQSVVKSVKVPNFQLYRTNGHVGPHRAVVYCPTSYTGSDGMRVLFPALTGWAYKQDYVSGCRMKAA
ncbi:hypothetical protein BKA91DRAFT_136709 [Yarrowia lipolytica]|nr:hypothetical protein BKA91DRAFT_136709 [Yarrowia lipolytica]KAE8173338.1 hypothetical protein BKA90DRAFT_135923 [Yarrowia lipolytica]RMI95734.1 hypothetical protein BD777DRAFT_129610 [Yarrowia lipolytica]